MGNRRRYAYQPVGMDAFAPKTSHPQPGSQVVFSNQGGVSHRAGRFRHVENAETGDYHGMVLASSLVPVTKKNPGDPTPLETGRAASLINDRRIATP
jgi:hypothetical protein